jgi:sarcosine oxidase
MARLDGSYDVLVVGLGSMGAAAARTLAARGLRVLGLETFGVAHDQGSAHGGTRIVRQSYFEGSAYVPLLRRAYEGWHELAQESGRDLLRCAVGSTSATPRAPSLPAASRPRACTA